MSKRSIIVLTLIFLVASLLGCTSKANGQNQEDQSFFIEDNKYGTMQIDIVSEKKLSDDYKHCVEEGKNIISAYLKDKYEACKIIPISVIEMYSGSQIPKGMQHDGKIYINVDKSIYYDNIDIAITVVHELLHFNGHIKVEGLTEKDTVTLSEYIVYGLTKKVCCAYDEELYMDADYGNTSTIPQLDEYFDLLCEIYLGNVNLTKDLQRKILEAFG